MGPRNRHCRAVDVRTELGYYENVRVFAVDHSVDGIEHSLGQYDLRMSGNY